MLDNDGWCWKLRNHAGDVDLTREELRELRVLINKALYDDHGEFHNLL